MEPTTVSIGPESIRVGIDLGQRIDPSAICIVTCEPRAVTERAASGDPRTETTRKETAFRVQHVERLPLGMGYQEQVAHIVALLAAVQDQEIGLRTATGMPETALPSTTIYLDSTGCGIPVAELLQAALQREPRTSGSMFFPLMFTAGMTFDKWKRPAGILGKSYLVSRLEALSQARPTRIKIPTPRDPATGGAAIDPNLARDVEAMLAELHLYYRTVSQDGQDSYNAPMGKHDDLCVSLGLATIEDAGSTVGVQSFNYW